LRRLIGDPDALTRAAYAYITMLDRLKFDRIAGLPYAAIPVATAISLQSGWPMIYPRKETKAYGTQSAIEGPFTPGERVVVIDDLITTGGSKFEAIEKLEKEGLEVSDVAVLVDRSSGAEDEFIARGLHLHAVFTLPELLSHWKFTAAISPKQYETVLSYLEQA
jgi:uridine monophosphate synthetase